MISIMRETIGVPVSFVSHDAFSGCDVDYLISTLSQERRKMCKGKARWRIAELIAGDYALRSVSGSFFSLSHAAGVSVAASAQVRLGVDIERVRPIDLALKRFAYSLSDSRSIDATYPCFSLDEKDVLLWTIKEAVVKAVGVGLAGILDVWLSFDNDRLYAHLGGASFNIYSRQKEGCIVTVALERLDKSVKEHVRDASS